MAEHYLLDTHTLLWWSYQPHNLPTKVVQTIETGSEIFVSAVSAYEIAFKHTKGLLPEAALLVKNFAAEMEANTFKLLSITPAHAQLAGSYDLGHRDPWDRILAAQARLETLVLVSKDAVLDQYGAERLWDEPT